MPEGIEVEMYRRAAATAVGRVVTAVELPDLAYTRHGVGPADLAAVLVGERVVAMRRRGKLLLADIGEVTLGLRFGMTGRLIVDADAVIEELEYASTRDDPAWDRFRLLFEGGGSLVMRDQRRLGSVEVDPDEAALGMDLFDVDARRLRGVLAGSSRPIKARLMDQAQVAGLGNLLTDEILWRAGIDPNRPADSLSPNATRRLLHHLRRVPGQLLERGGSHMGDLQDERHEGGTCPRDGTPLRRHTIGGRTTYACPKHQL